MKIPIQYALTYPERPPAPHERIDFGSLRQMTFLPPDLERFRCLALAYQALETGGTAPAVLNAANEVAVGLFLDGRLPFSAIPEMIEEALSTLPIGPGSTLDDLIAADAQTRASVRQHAAAHSPTT
jgi:1-deoxy-D-xylulose-5-phosphate reductoisomerase